jgi:hypothetical protein
VKRSRAYVGGGTLKAHTNCGSICQAVDSIEREAFADEFDRKIAGEAGPSGA